MELCSRHRLNQVLGRAELYEHLEHRYATDPDVFVEEVECLAACDHAPLMQVNYDYHGHEMRERLEKVWRYAGEADKQAVHIELLADGDLAGTARQLAAAAAKAAAAAAEKTDLDMNRCVALPDLSELVTQANAFREQAAAYIGG